VGYVLSED